MTLNSKYPNSLSIEEALLNSKALEPLTEAHKTELARIQTLDVSAYSEADVRAEVIDPIIRALGYQKETYFSLAREKHLKVLDKDLFIDYSMTLWSQNFWLIEAKKVQRKRMAFSHNDLNQALQYATHPEINAALVVLCDGRIIDVYDREVSVVDRVLRVEVARLSEEFDKLRALLAPWQLWFFEKRRVIRSLDKVFDQEINMSRLEEFRRLVDRRLLDKRTTVLRNYQSWAQANRDVDQSIQYLAVADTSELVNLQFFLRRSAQEIGAISRTLVSRCNPDSFRVLYAVFPDDPRDTNDTYWASALHFLLALTRAKDSANWLPSFLGRLSGERRLEVAAQNLISLCLTYFAADEGRKTVLLYAAAVRRVAKQMMIMIPDLAQIGNARHALVRHLVSELDMAQFMSSPEGHGLRQLDEIQMQMTARFCHDCQDSHDRFDAAVAKQKLKDLWVQEQLMLSDGTKYREACAARNLSESATSEAICVGYDQLGHECLCAIAQYPEWTEYALAQHRSDIERIASYGSWQAREFLGLSIDAPLLLPSAEEISSRFFYGDTALLAKLSSGYGIKHG